jgi:hypothetical protein
MFQGDLDVDMLHLLKIISFYGPTLNSFSGLCFEWVSLVKLGLSGLCFEWGSMVELGFNGLCFKVT